MTPSVDEKLCNERTHHLSDAVRDLNATCEKINKQLEKLNSHEVSLAEHEIKITSLEKAFSWTWKTAVIAVLGFIGEIVYGVFK